MEIKRSMAELPLFDRKKPTNAIHLSQEQRLNWLRLLRSDNVGPGTFRDLINHFGSAGTVLEALPNLIAKGGAAGKIKIASLEAAEKELQYAEKSDVQLVGLGEPDYPVILRNIDYPPPLISVKGNAEILNKVSVAIVGSRNASIAGKKLAANFASQLGKAGTTIVSGLARGIDASAHEHSLSTGTVAVFAGGVDRIFPEENQALAHSILENGGAFLSEMPLGWSPRSKDFPRRNRLVAGLCEATLVIEAAKRSGSLISARLANEAGRSVYAIPGSPLDPRSEGTNWLIRQGAILATKPEDILEDLGTRSDYGSSEFIEEEELAFSPPHPPTEDIKQSIVETLGPAPIEIDDLVRFSNASIADIQIVLIELDLAGRLERHSGNRVSLID